MVGPLQISLDYTASQHSAYMLDTGRIITKTVTSYDALGHPVTAESIETVTCSFLTNRAKQVMGTARADAADVFVRFPTGTEIDADSQFELTVRMRRTLDADEVVTYDVDGEIERGPYGIVVPMKRNNGAPRS